MHAWAATLALADAASLAPLRLADLEVLSADELWVRGSGEIPRAVPWRAVFEIHGEDALRHPGHLLSAGRLPAGSWQNLAKWLSIVRPALLREGVPPVRATLRLASATISRPAALLGTSAECWREYVIQAPEVRLRGLRFAQSDCDRVFVAGSPLPSIPGTYFSSEARVAAPAGYAWEPAVSAELLQAALGLAEDEMAVLLPDQTVLRIPARAWLPASRAAVRQLTNHRSDAY